MSNKGRQWTEEQREAISARGCNLLVSAAAGAGKTAVLVERILGLIRDGRRPVDIDRLLVVTFTNAAAAEMRERIAQAISTGLREGEDSGRLNLQLALLARARITTIHSFCLDVLKQYFYHTDLDPGFRIADESESAILKADVLDELLEGLYSGDIENSGFAVLSDCYGGDLDDSALMRLVIGVYDFSRSSPDPDGWLQRMAAKFSAAGGAGEVLESLAAVVLSGVAGVLEGALAEMEAALGLCRRPGGPVQHVPVIEDDIAVIRGLIHSCEKGWDEACGSFGEVRFAALKKVPAGVDQRLKDQVAAIRNKVKKRVKDTGGTFLARSLADHASDLEKAGPVVSALAGLVMMFAESYRQAKVSRGLVDFSDLEHYCLEILGVRGEGGELSPSEVALDLRDRFEEVLVDEYQDINPVQEAIIKLVARPQDPPNLFMVGDVKQSIYRFRLADPTLFLEKYTAYSVPGKHQGRLINLSRNFRSRREIIDSVNYVFRQIMLAGAAELDYGPEEELVYGAGVYDNRPDGLFADRRVELHLLDRARPDPGENGPEEADREAEGTPEDPPDEDASTDDYPPEEEPGAVQAEARLAAGRIRDLIEGGLEIYDSGLGAFRPAGYRDVAVLMRATRGRAPAFADEMKRMGVPASAEPDTGYFQSTEIETMVSLLKILDNPRQDIPLASVLRSPVAGLGAEELALLRMAGRQGDLWDAVVAAARLKDGELAGRLSKFMELLDRWRDLGRRAAMSDLIWTIYRETGYYHHAGATPGGAQRQANLRALHHWAGQYEATTFRGISTFLRFIERMRERGEDPGRARTLAENENVVTIMSIHKSKGLEFPVVIIPGLGGRFNLKDLGSQILLHREMGFGPTLVDPEARIAYPTLARLAVRERMRREALAEEMRILYVAMTRAREKLIMIGSTADLRRSSGNWSRTRRPITEAGILNAGSYLDWLCPALAGHPDGAPLREAEAGAGVEDGDPSRWLIKTAAVAGLEEAFGEAPGQPPHGGVAERLRRGEKIEGQWGCAGEVQRRLSWAYPAREAAGKPAKVSVTGIGEAAVFAPPGAEGSGDSPGTPLGQGPGLPFLRPAYARPAFLSRKRDLTAAERGSALHAVMRHLDLNGKLDSEGVAEQAARMVERELITGDQAAAVDCRKVAHFFRSPLGRRVLAAGSVKREITFSLAVPAGDVYPDLQGGLPPGERVLVQGVIDCLADEGDGFLLIDYKTGHLTGKDPGALAQKYSSQMDWYSRAVEAATCRPVKERCLYFFDLETGLRV